MDQVLNASLVIGQTSKKIDAQNYNWTVYVNDTYNIIQSVKFKLHPSFSPRDVLVTQPPFSISRQGWGDFTIDLIVTLSDGHVKYFAHSLVVSALEKMKIFTVPLHGNLSTPFVSSPKLKIGNYAQSIGPSQWRWAVYLESEQSHLINKVDFILHKTFSPNIVSISHPPYKIEREGWGEFSVKIRVQFKSGHVAFLKHPLSFSKPYATIFPIPSQELPHVTNVHTDWLKASATGNSIFNSHSVPVEFNLLKVIDWQKWTNGTPQSKLEIGKELLQGLTGIGFVIIQNHTVPIKYIKDSLDHAEYFFNARKTEPKAFKKLKSPPPPVIAVKTTRGYSDTERLNPVIADVKESFDYGLSMDGNSDTTYIGDNKWPQEGGNVARVGFKDCAMNYLMKVYEFSLELLRATSLGLGLSENGLDQYFAKPLVINRYLKYPSQPLEPMMSSMGAGSHTDFGGFTIIYSETQGLEVLDEKGNNGWVRVPVLLGSFVVNTGYIMQKLTNGLVTAAKHRVLNRTITTRYSMATFLDPNPNAQIAPLANFVNDQNQPKYSPCISGHKGVLYAGHQE